MTPEQLQELLQSVAHGRTPVEEALARLRVDHTPIPPEITLDLDRGRRCGHPEVIYGEGKSVAQVLAVAERLVLEGEAVLATRLRPEALDALAARYPEGRPVPEARLFHRPGAQAPPPAGLIAVLSAGTSDQGVAEEAAWTAQALGAPVRRARDVGVAGLHRLLVHRELLREASALVVVAGMEGALPSVVGGLTARPVIAVPTSVGYGASLGGLTALFAMLNSCASGVTVVNIDNGFGAGYAATMIARLAADPARSPAAEARP